MRERIIFLVDMDAFFASCEQLWEPALQGQPVLVCGNPKTRSVVAACSYEAKRFGIRNGMSVREALSRCPQARPVAGHPERYLRVARAIFRGLERLTPLVEVVSIDEAFLDVSDTWRRFLRPPEIPAGPRALALQLQREIEAEHGLSCTIGIGPNKLLAKLSADRAKPHGIGCIRLWELPGALAPLPVEAVSGIGPRWGCALRQMGVRTLGDLARMPLAPLTGRFGVLGERFRQMALGIDPHPVLPVDAPDLPKSMGHAYTLERDVTDTQALAGVLLKLSLQVSERLRRAHLHARTVVATVRFKNFSTRSRQRTLDQPLCEGLTLYRAALQLVGEIRALAQPLAVRLVGVGVAGLTSFPGEPDWWQDKRLDRRLLQTLDRINDTYGEETVTQAAAAFPLVTKTRGYFDRRWMEPPAQARDLLLRGRHPPAVCGG